MPGAAALGKLHKQDLIHKDIKPAKIGKPSFSGGFLAYLAYSHGRSILPREQLVTHSEAQNLLLVGAYRSTSVRTR
jgi:hypothetical protein